MSERETIPAKEKLRAISRPFTVAEFRENIARILNGGTLPPKESPLASLLVRKPGTPGYDPPGKRRDPNAAMPTMIPEEPER